MSKATRRQREDDNNNDVTNDQTTITETDESSKDNSMILQCDNEIVFAVKNQMTLLGQNRSDIVDVRNNELGLRECHIVAALLGLNKLENGCRAMKEPSNAEKKKMKKELREQKVAEGGGATATTSDENNNNNTDDVSDQIPSLIPIPPFFEKVHTMRLQLGSSILSSKEFVTDNNKNNSKNEKSKKNNLNNLSHDGGFDIVLAAIDKFHAPTLRKLDLSRNRFFIRNSHGGPAALKARVKEMEKLSKTIISCQNLNLLCLSHNVNLRSDGAIVVATACTRLPFLKALLMQRCSIDDKGAVEIAKLFAQGKLPAIMTKRQQQESLAAEQKDGEKNSSSSNSSVVLTVDLSCNRIGAIGLDALRKAIPDCVGLGAEKQSPPLEKKREMKK